MAIRGSQCSNAPVCSCSLIINSEEVPKDEEENPLSDFQMMILILEQSISKNRLLQYMFTTEKLNQKLWKSGQKILHTLQELANEYKIAGHAFRAILTYKFTSSWYVAEYINNEKTDDKIDRFEHVVRNITEVFDLANDAAISIIENLHSGNNWSVPHSLSALEDIVGSLRVLKCCMGNNKGLTVRKIAWCSVMIALNHGSLGDFKKMFDICNSVIVLLRETLGEDTKQSAELGYVFFAMAAAMHGMKDYKYSCSLLERTVVVFQSVEIFTDNVEGITQVKQHLKYVQHLLDQKSRRQPMESL